MSVRLRLIGAVTGVLFAAILLAAATPPQLAYVVVLSRHGVRAPTWPAERLNQYSASPWPDFKAPPGELTPHGHVLMARLGADHGEWLRSQGLLREPTCASAARIFVWADTDQRTLETGRAVAETLVPGCAIPVRSVPTGDDDPLFDPLATGLVTLDGDQARRAAEEQMHGSPQSLFDGHRAAFDTLDRVLTGGRSVAQRVVDPTRIGTLIGSERGVEWSGAFATGSTLSENLLLEYANGLEGDELGWGRLTREGLLDVLTIHARYADVVRRTAYVARARGSNLLTHVIRSMEQGATGRAITGALGRPGDVLLFIAGHDTNISNVSGMLDLSWHLPGYVADDTPPGGALVFSLWRNATAGALVVRLSYLAQSLDQMRAAAPLTLSDGPEIENLAIPGCATAPPLHECPWNRFVELATHAIDAPGLR